MLCVFKYLTIIYKNRMCLFVYSSVCHVFVLKTNITCNFDQTYFCHGKNDFPILIFFQNVRDFFTEILFFKHFQKIRDFSDFQKIRFFQILTFSGNNKNMSRFDATFLEWVPNNAERCAWQAFRQSRRSAIIYIYIFGYLWSLFD